MFKLWILFLFCIVAHVHVCQGSAWLQDPPSRSAAWYYQIKTPVNYNFRNLDCGGVPVKINPDGRRNCGVCGDPYTDKPPRDNELGGKYANPRVLTRFYETGQVAEISIWNNLPGAPGFYEFRLCDEESNQTQACLDKYLLTIKDTGKTYMEVPRTQGLVIIHVQLPPGVTCDYCLLQWRFRKETYAGCDDQKWCRVKGAQTEYYNCADVMIGYVGQPKPSYIEDPIYSASDYGSAYDVATTRTDEPDGSNLNGTTTEAITTTTTAATTTTTKKGVPIFTIPTVFPVTTSDPITTSTINPISTVTTQLGTTSKPESPRLVIDSNGNSISSATISNGNGRGASNNRYVLVLLSLIPLLGAVSLQNSKAIGPIPPPAVPPSAPVPWARALPIYPIQMDDNYGFGNFASGIPAYSTSGTYGGKKGTYGSKSSYHAGYSIFNGGSLASKTNTQVTNTGLINQLPVNQQNTNTFMTNNINRQWNQQSHYNGNSINKNNAFLNNGRGHFMQNPVVWNKNGVTVNSGLTNHVFPRSVNSYQPNTQQYSQPITGIQQKPSPHQNEYGTSLQSGYAPMNSIAPPNRRMSVGTNTNWPVHNVQRGQQLQSVGVGQGTQNWINTAVNTENINKQNTGGFDPRNNANINAVGNGQRLPLRDTATQRMHVIPPKVTTSDDTFNLPGIESASRFQVNGPRMVSETSKPRQNFFDKQNLFNGGTNRNNRRFLVNEWYNMLIKRLQIQGSRSL